MLTITATQKRILQLIVENTDADPKDSSAKNIAQSLGIPSNEVLLDLGELVNEGYLTRGVDKLYTPTQKGDSFIRKGG